MSPATPQTCVLLAGGLGTRLKAVLGDRPKCLAPVGNRSFLRLQIAALAAAGVTEVVLSLGHLADQVIDEVRAHDWPLAVRWVVEEQPLGTGGAVRHVLDTSALDEVLVANGDTYLSGSLGAMLRPLDRVNGERFRMAVVQVPDRARFGGVESDAEGRLVRFVEKGQAGAGPINAGLYRLCRSALPSGQPAAFSMENDVLPALAAQRQVGLSLIDGEFIDIGVPVDYARFCQLHGA